MSEPVILVRKDHTAEFDCRGCGARVIVVAALPGAPAKCLTCLYLEENVPDLETRAAMRRLLDNVR